MNNKEILQKANSLITKGDYEGFLSFCTEDTKWSFVGDQILNGKDEVREYMEKAYVEPPKLMVDHLIAENDFVTAVGKISMKNRDGETLEYFYCDVWKFKNNKMEELTAFVIEN